MSHQNPLQCQTPTQQHPQEQVLGLTLNQTLHLPSNHPSVRDHLGNITTSRDRWRGFVVIILIVLIVVVGVMLYSWWKQNMTNNRHFLELQRIRRDTRQNGEILGKISKSLITRSNIHKPPRLIGHLISTS